MDGTLVDSTAAVERAWKAFAETYTGLDVQKVLESASHGLLLLFAVLPVLVILADAHGVRTTEILRIHCGIDDPDQLQVSLGLILILPSGHLKLKSTSFTKREAERFEETIVQSSQENGRRGIVCLPGVKDVIKVTPDRMTDQRAIHHPATSGLYRYR